MKDHSTSGSKKEESSYEGMGLLRQRQPGYYILRIKVPAGKLESGQLPVLAKFAQKYGRGELHLTTRQGVEIPWISSENLKKINDLVRKAGLSNGISGPFIRVVTACPGNLVCRHGIVNAQEFGRKLDAVYAGAPVPHKVKIAVAGCPNSCTKPRENDIGFAGMAEPSFTPENCIACKKCLKACKEGAIIFSDDRIAIDAGRCVTCGDCIAVCKKQALTLERSGFAVYIGGKMGRHPVLGMKIAEFADEETATGLLDRTLAFYRREGRPRERLADTLRRSGKKKAIQEILGR